MSDPFKPYNIGPGITRHHDRIDVRASIGSGKNKITHPVESFPTAHDAEITKAFRATLEASFHRQKMKLKDEQAKNGGRTVRGLVSGDIARYLKLVKTEAPVEGVAVVADPNAITPRLYQEREQQLAWWAEQFGNRRRADITGLELQEALKTLKRSASTKNKYRQAFSSLWTKLEPSAKNPFSEFPVFDEPKPKPRDVPYEFIDLMLAYIRPRGRGRQPSQTHAFLHVEAYTPVTRAQAELMDRTEVDWTTGVITRPERHKGDGQPAMKVQLTPEGLAAFRLFDAADCWGKKPSRSSIRRILIAARDKAYAQLSRTRPDLDLSRARTMSPYALRHSFATFVVNTTANTHVAQQLLGHADLKTTMGYIQTAMPKLVQETSGAIAEAFATRPKAEVPLSADALQTLTAARRKKSAAGGRTTEPLR
jgi:integrase/recombinase XerC